MSSTFEAAIVEEGLLLRRGVASEQTVAMGEAAEPADDGGVLLGIFEVFAALDAPEQRHAMQLVRQMLGMHEGQIEEFEQVRIHPAVGAPADGAAGDVPRQ